MMMNSKLILRILRSAKYSTYITLPIVSIAGAYYYRPLPDLKSGDWGGPSHYIPKLVTDEKIKKRKDPFFSKEAITEKSDTISKDKNFQSEFIDKILKLGYFISRYVLINIISLVAYVGMELEVYNKLHIVDDDRYQYLISSINSRNKNEALLTISNHCSTIDDPTLFTSFVPTSIKISPLENEKLRWTLCSQEICFKNDLLSTVFGAGKVMPIKRGAGISQPLLHAFALKISSCDWVHIFPEGKIVQSGELGSNYYGTRSKDKAKKIGKLKWGVGKLIAHSSVPIRVIPFHHVGMEFIIPQKETGEIIHKYPLGGCDVKLRVGKQIVFDDMIKEYEDEHGKLYKYGSKCDSYSKNRDRLQWQNCGKESHELELYSRITRRIEDALEVLERESKEDNDSVVKNLYQNIY